MPLPQPPCPTVLGTAAMTSPPRHPNGGAESPLFPRRERSSEATGSPPALGPLGAPALPKGHPGGSPQRVPSCRPALVILGAPAIRICPTPGFYTGRRKVPFITRGKTPAPSQRPAWILACPAWAPVGTSKGGHGQEAPTPCEGSCTLWGVLHPMHPTKGVPLHSHQPCNGEPCTPRTQHPLQGGPPRVPTAPKWGPPRPSCAPGCCCPWPRCSCPWRHLAARGLGGARSGRPQVFGSVGHSPAGTPALGGGSGGPRAPPPGPAPGALAHAGSPPWCRRGQLRGCFALRLLERG